MQHFIQSQPVLVLIAITIFTVVGDAYLKQSSHLPAPFKSYEFIFGFIVYAITAFLWVFIYKSIKFSTSGALYSIITMLLFVMVGVFFFRESLTKKEILGLFFGIVSFLLLGKYL